MQNSPNLLWSLLLQWSLQNLILDLTWSLLGSSPNPWEPSEFIVIIIFVMDISVVHYCWSSLRHIAPYRKMQNGINTCNKQKKLFFIIVVVKQREELTAQ